MADYQSTNTDFPFTPYVDPFTRGGPPPNMPVLTHVFDVLPPKPFAPAITEPRPARRVDPDEQALIDRQAADRMNCRCGRGWCVIHADADDDGDDEICEHGKVTGACHHYECPHYEDADDDAGHGDAPYDDLAEPPAHAIDPAPTENLAAAAHKAAGMAPHFDYGTVVDDPVDAADGPPCFLPTWGDLAMFALDADKRFPRHGVMLDCPHHAKEGLGQFWFIGGVPGSHDHPVTSLIVWAARHWACGGS